jgi:hypothetical protein
MPSYNVTGPACYSYNETVECRCAECFSWTRSATAGPISSVQVQRIDMDGTVHVFTRDEQKWTGEDGTPARRDPPTIWCPAKHDTGFMPLEGRTYLYKFEECNANGCSAYSEEHHYVAAPYWVNVFHGPAANLP